MNGDNTPASENLVDLINQLVEPPMPLPVQLVPQAAGWWVLGALFATALAFGVWRGWLRWRANGYRRAALAELAAAGDDPAAIAIILRRAALAAFPREEVAARTGPDWVEFLRKTSDFPESAGTALIRAPYAPDVPAGELHASAERWIRSHRRAP